MEVVVERCAGLDVHQKTVMACVRSPGEGKKREEKVREFTTFTSGLRELRDWLKAEGVTQVAMEATGIYWRPVWYVLEELDGVEVLVVNARHVKNVPGRKTDVKGCAVAHPAAGVRAAQGQLRAHRRDAAPPGPDPLPRQAGQRP